MAQANHQTILIVDDTPTNIEVLANALRNEGYQVAVALDGESAIAQVHYKPPALILLDVMMPGIDGFETCQRLKADAQTQDIPIIFMTALSEAVSKSKGLSLGAVDYITKPFEAEEVLARVKTHLRLDQLTVGLEQEVEKRTAELTTALDQLKDTQAQLVQSERMSLIGELSAGVAFEISNPINFIKGNLPHISTYFEQLMELAAQHELMLQQQQLPLAEEQVLPISAADLDLDLDFVREDLPKILTSFQRGADRIQKLVSDLCIFADSDKTGRKNIHIHDLLESCLTLLGHKLREKTHRPSISIHKAFQHKPVIECYPAALSQAFMGILLTYVNSLEVALDQVPDLAPQISIQIKDDHQDWVVVVMTVNLEQIFSRSGLQEELISNVVSTASQETTLSSNDVNLHMAQDIVIHQHGGRLYQNDTPGQTEIQIALRTSLEGFANSNSDLELNDNDD